MKFQLKLIMSEMSGNERPFFSPPNFFVACEAFPIKEKGVILPNNGDGDDLPLYVMAICIRAR